jgi:hypothetical protein
MISVTSELIKQSIISELLRMFPEVSVYKEAKTSLSYPHFFIYQISLSDEQERKNYHILTYSMDLRYRVASDPSTDLKLQQNIDSVALKLLNSFNIISCRNEFIRCENKSIEKENGVLHFMFDIRIMVKNVSDEENNKFDKLKVEVKTNGR